MRFNARACLLFSVIHLTAAVALAQGSPSDTDCPEDPAMSQAAHDLLERPDRPDAEALRAAARRAGSDVPNLDAILLRPGGQDRAAFLDRARRRYGNALRCGEALHGDRSFLLVGPDTGALRPIGADAFEVWLAAGYAEPRIYARDVEGRVFEAPTYSGAEVGVPSDLQPPVILQLLARGPAGPIPVAERRLSVAEAVVPPDDARPSDRPIVDRVDALRERANVRALLLNGLLVRAADAQAEHVCRTGRAVHEGRDGDPEERLARQGVRARHVGETVAFASDLETAYRRTEESPSHYAALTDPRFTDIGVGVYSPERGATCMVVLLAAWPRAVPYGP